ncbi:SprB repeat-containing protein [Algoriphagus boritolerans]|uniref:SprB repeat-containing protein n=1 Tax=Algoriphagus boritolerans TaxID=308111 RepID=UPI002FCE23E6
MGRTQPQCKTFSNPLYRSGCPGEELLLNVTITESIEPALPIGSSGLCGPNEVLTYQVPYQTPGRNYTWTVSGGSLVSGQNSPEVEILWDLSAAVKTVYFEETSTLNGACSGTSEVLEVTIYPEFQLGDSEIQNPACPGESNGSIRLNPSGGSGNYDFSWAHDPILKAGMAENLPSGDYKVTISDATGCAVEQVTFSLKDPEPLRVEESIQVISNSCFGVADGEFLIQPSGGNPPYTVAGLESIWDGNDLRVFGIAPGEYELTVLDSRECSIPVSVTLEGRRRFQSWQK